MDRCRGLQHRRAHAQGRLVCDRIDRVRAGERLAHERQELAHVVARSQFRHDAAADELLTDNPLALLVGMLLDQQIAMETAFTGPLKIEQRTGSMDAAAIAA